MLPIVVFLMLCLCFAGLPPDATCGVNWPEIADTSKTVHVSSADSPQAGLELVVTGVDGKALYSIKCHSGNYGDDPGYSGLMQCYLISLYSKESVGNLLTETYGQVSDWTNRGRFLDNHLVSPCSEYPEWGRTRHFRLRHMEITLEMSDLQFAEKSSAVGPILKSYSLTVSARRSPGATSAIAERTETPQPPWFYTSGCRP
jgi:hypothetical protein